MQPASVAMGCMALIVDLTAARVGPLPVSRDQDAVERKIP
jgi:hypothetical protein